MSVANFSLLRNTSSGANYQVGVVFNMSYQNRFNLKGQKGGAALEYILVSTFAAVISMAALGFIGKVVRGQLTTLAGKLGVEDVPEFPTLFDGAHE